MWRANLLLKPVGPGTIRDVVDSMATLVQSGATVINLSLGVRNQVSASEDSSAARDLVIHMMKVLRSMPTAIPLLVISAGNENRDAYRNGLPALKDSIPDQCPRVVWPRR